MDLDIQEKDVIVVGSGPGGATVAKELSQRNKKVLILEWGDNAPLTGSFWQGARTLLLPGRSLLEKKGAMKNIAVILMRMSRNT